MSAALQLAIAANANEGHGMRRKSLGHRVEGCPFCEIPEGRVIASNELVFAIRDAFPMTPLHTLLIPKRHARTYFDLFAPERRAISIMLDQLHADILKKDRAVAGFNILMNSGEVAGQTVEHAHVHLIPRRGGEMWPIRKAAAAINLDKADCTQSARLSNPSSLE